MTRIEPWLAVGLVAAALLVVPGLSQAQPPNDACVNAITASCPSFVDTQDTTTATNEPGEPSTTCGAGPNDPQSHSVWYSFTNTESFGQVVTISTAGSNYDTLVQVYSGTCGAVSPEACNDDANGTLQSEVQFTAAPGVSHLIKVASFDNTSGGTLQFSLTCSLPVPTLSQWAQILLVSVLLVVGFLALSRRRTARV